MTLPDMATLVFLCVIAAGTGIGIVAVKGMKMKLANKKVKDRYDDNE